MPRVGRGVDFRSLGIYVWPLGLNFGPLRVNFEPI